MPFKMAMANIKIPKIAMLKVIILYELTCNEEFSNKKYKSMLAFTISKACLTTWAGTIPKRLDMSVKTIPQKR
jgi:hypothetical protein